MKRLAEENVSLAEARNALAQRIEEATQQSEQTKQQLQSLAKQYVRSCDEESAVGLTNTFGLVLRKQRETLPNLAHRQNVNALQQSSRDSQSALLLWRDQRSPLADIDLATHTALQSLNWVQNDDGRELVDKVHDALQTKREYLDGLIADQDRYFYLLASLENAERRLIKETERYAGYIDERVLWIASAVTLGASDVRNAGDALWWLAGPDAWLDVVRTLRADAVRNPVVPMLAACLFLAMFYWKLRFRASPDDRRKVISPKLLPVFADPGSIDSDADNVGALAGLALVSGLATIGGGRRLGFVQGRGHGPDDNRTSVSAGRVCGKPVAIAGWPTHISIGPAGRSNRCVRTYAG